MLSLKNLFTLPFLSVPGFVPTLPPTHPPNVDKPGVRSFASA